MSNLKPCPFCGSEARLGQYIDAFYVECLNSRCFVNPSTHFSRKAADVINSWNTRACQTCADLSSDVNANADKYKRAIGRAFDCSICGFGLYDYCSMDESVLPNNELRYCPSCGAKVVR